ncbi:MAG: hypothetical protein AB1491_04965 [Thermodesulfobacteriota bacterium]
MLPADRSAAAPGVQPRRLALLAALPLEVRPFLRSRQVRRRQDLDLPLWEFSAGEGRGVLALTGMGGAGASRATLKLLAHYRPELLIVCGFAGALTPELPPGAVVLGTSFWHYQPADLSLKEIPVPPAPRPLAEMRRHLEAAGLPAFLGSCITTPRIIHKGSQGGPLLHLPAPVLDLESSAVAAIAASQDLALIGLRVVTDAAGEEIPDFLIPAAESGSMPSFGTVLTWLAADPRRLAVLLHLHRRSRTAAHRLALALNALMVLV